MRLRQNGYRLNQAVVKWGGVGQSDRFGGGRTPLGDVCDGPEVDLGEEVAQLLEVAKSKGRLVSKLERMAAILRPSTSSPG